MIIDLRNQSTNSVYHLMTQTIVPRPIAWVLTKNRDGTTHNLAPFSYFTAVSSNPPLLMFSAMQKNEQGQAKDTVTNIRREKEFVIHIANSEQINAVQKTAEPLAYGESELAANQLSLCDFAGTNQQRLTDTPIALSCHLYEEQSIGDTSLSLIFGKVTHLYVDDSAITANEKLIQIDAKNINPLARLGLGQFADITSIRRAK